MRTVRSLALIGFVVWVALFGGWKMLRGIFDGLQSNLISHEGEQRSSTATGVRNAFNRHDRIDDEIKKAGTTVDPE